MHRVVSLHEVLRSTLRMFGKIPHGLEVVFDLDDQDLPVSCAPTHLVQVFTNLIKNAFEATDGRGTVMVQTRKAANWAEIRVMDDGPGIDHEFLDRLFQPFQSTKKQGEGLGLGLSMARKVVEEHGGSLAYDSTYEKGACFVIRLPMARERVHAMG